MSLSMSLYSDELSLLSGDPLPNDVFSPIKGSGQPEAAGSDTGATAGGSQLQPDGIGLAGPLDLPPLGDDPFPEADWMTEFNLLESLIEKTAQDMNMPIPTTLSDGMSAMSSGHFSLESTFGMDMVEEKPLTEFGIGSPLLTPGSSELLPLLSDVKEEPSTLPATMSYSDLTPVATTLSGADFLTTSVASSTVSTPPVSAPTSPSQHSFASTELLAKLLVGPTSEPTPPSSPESYLSTPASSPAGRKRHASSVSDVSSVGQPEAKKPRSPRTKSAARSAACPRQKKEKKRDQNKNAATRYREKKRSEQQTLLSEHEGLEKRNAELKEKVDQMTREIKYLKDLMSEVYVLKGQM
ncbi:activating transcription factor of chaperone-like [Branchiostoma lanceolatum]|uniref:activating transcription factor of chaperone-like n=1 Tax=Branchiostoma lanceolatum TaxID=7740 RepID=UPI00345583C1